MAADCSAAGLRPGQTVAIMLPTSPAYFFTYLGILRAGGFRCRSTRRRARRNLKTMCAGTPAF
jgi:acyl-CoA synthetase (AMP-forming)/AMP-acid ligase II